MELLSEARLAAIERDGRSGRRLRPEAGLALVAEVRRQRRLIDHLLNLRLPAGQVLEERRAPARATGAAGRPLRIYLAARYGRHPEMRGYATALAAKGHTVTSRWILGGHALPSDGQPVTDAWAVRCATEDWIDLLAAQVVISFTEEPGTAAGRARGGRHVEFGAALALGKRCLVVGHRENVFHHLPEVEFYETWEAALAAVPAAMAAEEEAE